MLVPQKEESGSDRRAGGAAGRAPANFRPRLDSSRGHALADHQIQYGKSPLRTRAIRNSQREIPFLVVFPPECGKRLVKANSGWVTRSLSIETTCAASLHRMASQDMTSKPTAAPVASAGPKSFAHTMLERYVSPARPSVRLLALAIFCARDGHRDRPT